MTPQEQRESAIEMLRDHAEIPSYSTVYPLSDPADWDPIDDLIATATFAWPAEHDAAFAAGVEAAALAIEADQGFESRMERAYAARIVRRVLDRTPEPTE